MAIIVPVVAAIAISACASSGGDTSPAFSLPKLPTIESVAAIGSGTDDKPVGSATEVYARVARGANQCWFGASGPLKKDYIYNAEADAPSRGGKAEITLHVRDTTQPNPRGPKAYRIKIDPEGDGSTAKIETENLRLPEVMANGLAGDVGRWAKGEQGCAGATTAAGWAPQSTDAPAQPAPSNVKTAAKKKAKTAPAAAQKTPTP